MLLYSAKGLHDPAVPPPTVYHRQGRNQVLASEDLLRDFAERCQQPDAMSDMTYFLGKPGVLKRTPLLILLARPTQSEALTASDLLGAALLYEYRLSGIRTGLYTSNDRSGRNTLVAPPALRTQVALYAAHHLLERHAQVVLLSFRTEDDLRAANQVQLSAPPRTCRWAMRQRSIPEFLPLRSSYDDTLATIGQRTRSNLRYYRRRAERMLGCRFVPELEISAADLLRFNRDCMYAVADPVAAWRLQAVRNLREPILMAMRDRDGRLLSVLGGRRVGRSSEILWQMNRNGLPNFSLSLVMRSYFLEHEIERGAERFYVEGGTPHPIRESFAAGTVTDLALLRRTATASLIRRLARQTIEEENELASILFDPSLTWTRAEPPLKQHTRSKAMPQAIDRHTEQDPSRAAGT